MLGLYPHLLLIVAVQMAILCALCIMCSSGKRPQMKQSSSSKRDDKRKELTASDPSSSKSTKDSVKSSKFKKGVRCSKSPKSSKSSKSHHSAKPHEGCAHIVDATQRDRSSKLNKDISQLSAKLERIAKANKCVPAVQPTLSVKPEDLRWTKQGGTQLIRISNLTNDRQAMKVKCSDNYLYSVSPVYTIVEPRGTINVEVVRGNGDLKLDEMVFVTTKAKAEDQQAKALFAGSSGNPSAIVPLLSAVA